MPKYVLVYHGGRMADTPEAIAASMEQWGAWFGTLGAALVEGGAPFGASSTISADGSVISGGGANPATGYSILEATDLDTAVAHSKGCPVIANGGTVEVCEAMEM